MPDSLQSYVIGRLPSPDEPISSLSRSSIQFSGISNLRTGHSPFQRESLGRTRHWHRIVGLSQLYLPVSLLNLYL